MRRLLLSILLLLFLLNTIFSQSQEYLKGYIVNSNRDTIEGYIKDEARNNLSDVILFKTQLDQTPQKIRPNDVSSFYMTPSFYFEAIDFTKNKVKGKYFLRKLIDGETNLYEYKNRQQYEYILIKQSGESLHITKKDSVINKKIIIDNAYFGQLKYFLRDCPKIIATKSIKYNSKNLAQLVSTYNSCVFPSRPTSNLSTQRKLQIGFGLLGGVRLYNINISTLQSPKRAYRDKGTGVQFGGTFSLSYFKKISLQVGIVYTSYSAKTDIPFTLGEVFITHDVENIEVPIFLKYDLLSNKINPYLYGGIRLGKVLNGRSSEARNTLGTLSPEERYDLIFDRIIGFAGGIGLSFQLTEKVEAAFELGVNQSGMYIGIREDIKIKSLDLTTKINF